MMGIEYGLLRGESEFAIWGSPRTLNRDTYTLLRMGYVLESWTIEIHAQNLKQVEDSVSWLLERIGSAFGNVYLCGHRCACLLHLLICCWRMSSTSSRSLGLDSDGI